MSTEKSDKLSVIMLVASLPPLPAGGAELQALKLGTELKKKDVEIVFITPGKGSLKGKAEIDGMDVYYLNSLPARLFEFFSRLKKGKKAVTTRIEFDDANEVTNKITRRVGLPTKIYYTIFYWHSYFLLKKRFAGFQIIHAHTMEWSAIVAAKLGKALNKKILIKDSTMNGFESLARFSGGRLTQDFVIQQSRFVAMTRVIESNLKAQGIPDQKITLIPNGINLKPFQRAQRKALTALFVGNLYQQPAKGIDLLLKAWVNVIKIFPSAILSLAGDGYTKEYDEFVTKLGIENSVKFLGKQKNVESLILSHAIFVLPSRRERMSNALMEAMMYETPCVATDISGSQDLIANGVNGLLVPALNIDQLSKAIIRMFSEESAAAEMGKNAGNTIRNYFSISSVAEQYYQLYRSI